jgi:nucleoside-diphosphate-sugar epimerase
MNSLNKKKLAIFGSTGFIGKNIVSQLSNLYDVSVFLRFPLMDYDKIKFKDTKLYINQFNLENLIDFFINEHPDYIINLVSYVSADRNKQSFDHMIQSNFITVELILKAIILSKIKVKQFIHFGSTEEYGNQKAPFKEVMLPVTNSLYGISKLMATNLVQMYSKEYKIPATILRPSNIFGLYQSNEKLLPYIIQAIKRGEKFKVSNLEKTREFYSVIDLVYALKLIMNNKEPGFGEIYNLGYGSGISIINLINLIEQEIGKKAIYLKDSNLERINEPKEYVVSIEKFLLNFQHLPFKENFSYRLNQFIHDLINTSTDKNYPSTN